VSVFYTLALAQVPGIGALTARALLAHFGNAEEVFKATAKHLCEVPGLGPKSASNILNFRDFDQVQAELDFINSYQIKTLQFGDPDYPTRLAQCYDAPFLLFYRGNVDLNRQKVISIVGTRSATAYGKSLCEDLISGIKAHQPLVVSGLAYGIDVTAHKSCLSHQLDTLGVLAHGLDRMYPREHQAIARQMLQQGGLLSEFPSNTAPDRENFPKRNRIIAGLADATIVIEAHGKGGALITAELANVYNRDVFAYPGRVDDEQSWGCNYLIKTHRANLISQASDLEYLLGWDSTTRRKTTATPISLTLSKDQLQVYEIIRAHAPIGIDELQLKTGIEQSLLTMIILELEMMACVLTLPGKRYQLA
jgi:DNA processing protein